MNHLHVLQPGQHAAALGDRGFGGHVAGAVDDLVDVLVRTEQRLRGGKRDVSHAVFPTRTWIFERADHLKEDPVDAHESPHRFRVFEQFFHDVGTDHRHFARFEDVPGVDETAGQQVGSFQGDVVGVHAPQPKRPALIFPSRVLPNHFCPPHPDATGVRRNGVGQGLQPRQIRVAELDRAVALVSTVGHLRSASFHPDAVDGVVRELGFDPVLQPVPQPLHDHQNEDPQRHAQARQRRSKRVSQHVVGHFQPGVAVNHVLPFPPTRRAAEWSGRTPRRCRFRG